MQEQDVIIDTVEYRGYTVPVYADDYGQSYYVIIDDEAIGLGTYNFNYREDIEYIIDEKLDTIELLESGAKLSYFFNHGHRDIKLEYRTRLLNVWLEEDVAGIDDIKLDAKILLERIKLNKQAE